MRKRIGVFIGEVAQEYQKNIIINISQRAIELNYDVLFICMYGSRKDSTIYANGEAATITIPDYDSFDGIIVTEDVLVVRSLADKLYEEIKQKAKCPVVYLRTKRDEFYSVLIDNVSSIELMTSHLIEKHGFTDICFMAGPENSNDSNERLLGYTNTMKAHNIDYSSKDIYYGDFWKRESENAFNHFMKDRKNLDNTFNWPQAIICANDYMAIALADEFKKHGAKIPEDVCITGFDNIIDSELYNPALTTLAVNTKDIAIKAVDIIDDVNNGKVVNKVQRVPATLTLRESCGCLKHRVNNNVAEIVSVKNEFYSNMQKFLLTITDYQECIDTDDYLRVAEKHIDFLKADKAYVVSTDTENRSYKDLEDESVYTDMVKLNGILTNRKKFEMPNIKYPRRKIIPDEYWAGDKPNIFCMFGLHFKAKVYGYIVTTLPTVDNWFNEFTQSFLISLSNAIERCAAITELQDLETIKAVYHKDTLTGIMNRRGYDKVLQDMYNAAMENNTVLGIVSIDMDNLKVINDTFGHMHGDNALRTIAKAMKESINDGEYCARIGGDEFAVVLKIDYLCRSSDFKNKFLETLKTLSKDIAQYDVGASIGICETNEDTAFNSLIACIQEADRRMYADKKERKMERKN